jgi:hypothetical protein
MKLSHEPAAWMAVLSALLALFIGFGLHLSQEQVTLIMAAAAAVTGIVVRQNVTPTSKLEDAGINPDTLARKLPIILLACMLGAAAAFSACGGNPSPTLTPPGQVAKGADQVITTADTALTVLDGLTASGIVPKPITVKIAKKLEQAGHGGKAISAALDAYTKSRTADNWKSVQGAVTGVRGILNAVVDEVTDEHLKTTVRGVLQPIFDALLGILTSNPPPTIASHRSIGMERMAFACL